MEQCLQVIKARVFGDQLTAKKIWDELEPMNQKYISKDIVGYNPTEWYGKAPDLVLPALMEKYKQNPYCLKFLLSTENKRIMEASPNDSFWGTGCGLRDPALWQGKWNGKNQMGVALEKVRNKLQP